jgi:hypothetical protein
MSGWIKIYRKLLDWEWYSDIKTRSLFIHMLLIANHEDAKWRGIEIKKGSFISSLGNLSQSSGLTIRELRTALTKLKSTSEVTSYGHAEYTMFTVVNYSEYQSSDKPKDKPEANKGQAKDKQATTIKEELRIKEEQEEKEVLGRLSPSQMSSFFSWLEYRKSIKKPIKNIKTLSALVDKFNSESPAKATWVVNASIQNGYQGLFWDKYQAGPVVDPFKHNPKG